MKTYLIPEEDVENYHKTIYETNGSAEAHIKSALLGYPEMDIEEAKKLAKIGDCIIVDFENKKIPMQVIDKEEHEDGTVNCYLQSYHLLEKRQFDEETNRWKDCDLRKYLNGSFIDKFSPEFQNLLIPTKIHTCNYTTIDKFWIPSHEEIGYKDTSNNFVKNTGSKTYKYYEKIHNA